MNFFIAVFFVSLGIRMELGAARENLLASLVLSLFVLIGNPFIFIWIIARMGYGRRTAFLTSVTVAQISEFSFIFAALGLTAGLIDEATLSVIGLVGVVTIGVSAYMILYNHELYDLLERWGWLRIFGRDEGDEAVRRIGRERAGHVIIIGVNTLARKLVHGLRERGQDVLVIDTDPGKLLGLDADRVVGNAEDPAVLEEAGLQRARLLISTLQIEDANILLAYRAREAGVPCSIHAFDPSMVDDLQLLGADHLMVSKHDGIRQVAAALRDAGVID
jgi:voltage-gated potassium channel Kch